MPLCAHATPGRGVGHEATDRGVARSTAQAEDTGQDVANGNPRGPARHHPDVVLNSVPGKTHDSEFPATVVGGVVFCECEPASVGQMVWLAVTIIEQPYSNRHPFPASWRLANGVALRERELVSANQNKAPSHWIGPVQP